MVARRGPPSTNECTDVQLSTHQQWEQSQLQCGLYIKRKEDWKEGIAGRSAALTETLVAVSHCPVSASALKQAYATARVSLLLVTDESQI